MTTQGILPGVYTAVLTPMTSQLAVDTGLLIEHCRWLLQQGCQGLCLAGTTGEANSLTIPERISLVETVLEAGIEPGRLLVGTGCCALGDTLELTRHAVSHGVGGVLVLPPFYYKDITDKGMLAYFNALIEGVASDRLRIYLYHFPKLSGINLSFRLLGELIAEYPHQVVGMKDSGGDWSHMQQVIHEFPGFQLFSGTEKFLLDNLNAGGCGCISATANLTAPLAVQVFRRQQQEEAPNLQHRLSQLRGALESVAAVPGLKYMLASLSGNPKWSHMRPPHVALDDSLRSKLDQHLHQVSFDLTYPCK